MRARHNTPTPILRCRYWVAVLVASVLGVLLAPGMAIADVSYFIFGRATSVHERAAEIEADFTAAIPGVVPSAPEPADDPAPPVPLPGVTIEAYDAGTGSLLGAGRANREGFYNLAYNRPAEADHTVRFLLFLDFADGGRELVGSVDRDSTDNPIVVDDRLFSFDIEVDNDDAVRAGTAVFSSIGEFVFTEVGDVDMDDIYDQEADDAAGASLWGLTKPTSPAGHTLGPHLAFGATLELYGLFGEGTGPANTARYYRINHSGAESGSVCDPLFKKNYVIVGSSVEVFRVQLGPQQITTASGPESCVYELDERLAGQAIPGHPGRFYSTFWTELGMRAKWNTRGLANGDYVLSVEAWNAAGNPLPASGNDYADLSLVLNNTPPQSQIHTIRYLDGSEVLSDANPCQGVILNQATASTDDDSLRFEITASHADNLLRRWQLYAWHGHDTPDDEIAGATYAPPALLANQNGQMFDTPGSITYQTCAYRFRLRVWPRITNGYHLIYIRDDNWYAAVSVVPPTP